MTSHFKQVSTSWRIMAAFFDTLNSGIEGLGDYGTPSTEIELRAQKLADIQFHKNMAIGGGLFATALVESGLFGKSHDEIVRSVLTQLAVMVGGAGAPSSTPKNDNLVQSELMHHVDEIMDSLSLNKETRERVKKWVVPTIGSVVNYFSFNEGHSDVIKHMLAPLFIAALATKAGVAKASFALGEATIGGYASLQVILMLAAKAGMHEKAASVLVNALASNASEKNKEIMRLYVAESLRTGISVLPQVSERSGHLVVAWPSLSGTHSDTHYIPMGNDTPLVVSMSRKEVVAGVTVDRTGTLPGTDEGTPVTVVNLYQEGDVHTPSTQHRVVVERGNEQISVCPEVDPTGGIKTMTITGDKKLGADFLEAMNLQNKLTDRLQLEALPALSIDTKHAPPSPPAPKENTKTTQNLQNPALIGLGTFALTGNLPLALTVALSSSHIPGSDATLSPSDRKLSKSKTTPSVQSPKASDIKQQQTALVTACVENANTHFHLLSVDQKKDEKGVVIVYAEQHFHVEERSLYFRLIQDLRDMSQFKDLRFSLLTELSFGEEIIETLKNQKIEWSRWDTEAGKPGSQLMRSIKDATDQLDKVRLALLSSSNSDLRALGEKIKLDEGALGGGIKIERTPSFHLIERYYSPIGIEYNALALAGKISLEEHFRFGPLYNSLSEKYTAIKDLIGSLRPLRDKALYTHVHERLQSGVNSAVFVHLGDNHRGPLVDTLKKLNPEVSVVVIQSSSNMDFQDAIAHIKSQEGREEF